MNENNDKATKERTKKMFETLLGDVAHFTLPFTTAYPWSGSGFGAKFAKQLEPQ